MAVDTGDTAIVRSVIALGHELGLLVTAEGVEDASSLDSLRAFGCDRAQGYYFARPMDAHSLMTFLVMGSAGPQTRAPSADSLRAA